MSCPSVDRLWVLSTDNPSSTVPDRSNLTEKSTRTRSWSVPLVFHFKHSFGVPLIHVYLECKMERVLTRRNAGAHSEFSLKFSVERVLVHSASKTSYSLSGQVIILCEKANSELAFVGHKY